MAAEPAPSRAAPTRGSPDDPWLALGAASRLVGVGPETLRRWADSGKVESYTTPGGHRRFLRSSLEAMVNAPRRHRYGVDAAHRLGRHHLRRDPPAHAARRTGRPALAGAPHGRAARRVPALGPAHLPAGDRVRLRHTPRRARAAAGRGREDGRPVRRRGVAGRPVTGRGGRGVPLLSLAGAGGDRRSPPPPGGGHLGRDRRLPRGDRRDRPGAGGAGRLAPRAARDDGQSTR